jgi:hypothetical protein
MMSGSGNRRSYRVNKQIDFVGCGQQGAASGLVGARWEEDHGEKIKTIGQYY